MGCDIHLYVERLIGNEWQSADEWSNEYGDGEDVSYSKRFYKDRNYRLFAILADVRNGFGFAGVKTGEGFIPIAAPRGMPESASKKVKEACDRWNGDGHSHSWLTIQEILDFDWTQTTILQGWISEFNFFKWNLWGRSNGEFPDSYCGGISGPNIHHISEEEMIERVKGKDWKDFEGKKSDYYCLCKWQMPYHKCAISFWSGTIPRLLRLGKASEVRVVFWFDN